MGKLVPKRNIVRVNPSEVSKSDLRHKNSLRLMQWEEFGKEITEVGMERMLNIMKNSEDKEFVDIFMGLIEYFKPKMVRSENKSEDNVNFRIIYDDGTATRPVNDIYEAPTSVQQPK